MIEASTEIKPPGWAFGQRVHAPAFESGRRDGENWEPIVGTTSGSEPLLGCPTRSRHCKRHAPIASDPSRTVPVQRTSPFSVRRPWQGFGSVLDRVAAPAPCDRPSRTRRGACGRFVGDSGLRSLVVRFRLGPALAVGGLRGSSPASMDTSAGASRTGYESVPKSVPKSVPVPGRLRGTRSKCVY
jgi:hypothetical protein